MKYGRHRAVAVLSTIALIVSSFANAAPVSGQGTWETTLQGRDLDGNLSTAEAYYDTVLSITWLADANYPRATMDWDSAKAWAASLSFNSITGWRLPVVNPVDGTTVDDATTANNGSEDRGYNVSAPGTLYAGSTASEMAHLFYNTLGNKGYCDPTDIYPACTIQIGWGQSNTGPFANLGSGLLDGRYWSSTEYAPRSADSAWAFNLEYGNQLNYVRPTSLNAWAVHSGDVGAAVIPVPAAVWLFGSGLVGLFGFARRKVRLT